MLACALSGAVSGAEFGGDFTLTDHHGQPYSLTQARGKAVLLSFGFTSCPDVCPLTLNVVAAALRQLGPRHAEVEALFISLDPKRDSLARLRQYVSHFHPRIIGLRGQLAELTDLAARYSTRFAYRGDYASNSYSVDHASGLYVLDKSGEVKQIMPFGLPAEDIASAVLSVLDAPH